MSELLHPYYDIGPVVSANCWFNVIVGERGVGKTFGFIKRAIKRGVTKGEEFIYLRRYDRDMRTAKGTFFSQLSSYFPDHEFRINGWKGEYREITEQGDAKWKTLVYFLTLATAQSIKSADFINVRQIIFDEFIIEKGLIQYLPEEVKAFYGLYETVDRRRSRVRVYFLGNAAKSNNPYFIEWDIRPGEMEERTIMRNGFLYVHIAKSQAYRDSIAATPFGQFTAGTDYDKYAGKNEFHDEHNALIGRKPSRATPQWNLETRFGTFSAWADIDGVYYMQEELINWDAPTLTMLPEKMDENKVLLERSSRILARVRTAYRRGGSVYYDTPRTRNAFMEAFRR